MYLTVSGALSRLVAVAVAWERTRTELRRSGLRVDLTDRHHVAVALPSTFLRTVSSPELSFTITIHNRDRNRSFTLGQDITNNKTKKVSRLRFHHHKLRFVDFAFSLQLKQEGNGPLDFRAIGP